MSVWVVWLLVAAAWTPTFLGGGTTPPGVMAGCAAVGAALALAGMAGHAGQAPGWLRWGLVALAIIGLAAFLPTATGTPTWMKASGMESDSLGAMRTPVLWLSLEAWLTLAGGLFVFLAAASLRWDSEERGRMLVWWVAAISVLALVSALDAERGWSLWPGPQHWGPFPNRNQFATLLAVGCFLAVAMALRGEDRKGGSGSAMSWLWWFPALGLAGALVFNGSRAGVLLLAAGLVLWAGWEWLHRRRAAGVVAASVLIIGLAGFLATGSGLLERFVEGGMESDARWGVQRAAWGMALEHGALGAGVGTFQWIFPLYRPEVAGDFRILHPESDMAWLAAEMGIPALLIVLLLAGGCLFHSRGGRMRFAERAAVVAMLMVLLHACVDVSMHRWGAALPLLLLGAVLVGGRVDVRATRPPGTRWFGFAVLMIGAVTAGMWWTGRQADHALWRAGLEEVDSLLVEQYAGEAGLRIDRMLAVHPLDGRVHFRDGWRRLLDGDAEAAAAAFRRSRTWLEPHAGHAYAEGMLWRDINSQRALEAWGVALDRDPSRAHEYYGRMMQASRGHWQLREGLRWKASGHHRLKVLAAEDLSDAEFFQWLDEVLQEDPNQWQPLHRTLLAVWAKRGDWSRVIHRLEETPAWRDALRQPLAAALVREKMWKDAWEVIAPLKPAMQPPVTNDAGELVRMRRSWPRGAEDPVVVMRLAAAEQAEGLPDRAREVLEHGQALSPDTPVLAWMLAELHAANGDHEKAVQLALRATAQP